MSKIKTIAVTATIIFLIVTVFSIGMLYYQQPEKSRDDHTSVIEGLADVDEIEIIILESFPVQINVVARGSLPDTCTEIYVVTKREGNTYFITITTSRPADAICAQVVTPFEKIIPLDVVGLKAGIYTVEVNGVNGTFELQVDNISQNGGALSVSELLKDPLYDTEVRVYGRVSLLGELFCPCFELSSEGEKVLVWYDLMIEDDGTARSPVNVETVNNGDWIIVTGELKSEGQHRSLNDFWASNIEKIE
ncbi:hypothetical protein [[Eubacterium] cellulosolvens]